MIPKNISIKIIIDKQSIRSRDFINALQTVENVLFESDKDSVTEAINKLGLHPDVSKLLESMTLKKLKTYDDERIEFSRADNGSIIISGLAIGLGYFLLENTIGELFKDTIKEVEIYNKLKEYFIVTIDQKTSIIVNKLNAEIKKKKFKGNSEMVQSNKKDQLSVEFNYQGELNREERENRTWSELIIKDIESQNIN